jgi:transcriptional regulator with XRE-family HTH domain
MNQPLDVEVKRILEARRGEWQVIAEDAGVSHSWLSKFVNGHIPNPGLATLKKVHEAVERRSTDKAKT